MFILCVATPQEVLFAGDVVAVRSQCDSGWLDIHANHPTLVTGLTNHHATVTRADGSTLGFNVVGGVLEMLNNRMVILSDEITIE